MAVLTVFICFALFFGNIAITAYRAKQHLSEEKSIVGKVLVIVNCAIAILGCALVTPKIDLQQTEVLVPLDTNGAGTIIYLLTMWVILSILSGGILAVVTTNAALVVSLIKNRETALDRHAEIVGAEAGARIAMHSGGVIFSYVAALLSLQELIARLSVA